MITPAEYDLTVYKDREYSKVFQFNESDGTAKDLTGFTVFSSIRAERSRTSISIADFTCTHNDSGGAVTITLDRDTTEDITQEKGYWDLVLINASDEAYQYVYGKVTLRDTVTEVT